MACGLIYKFCVVDNNSVSLEGNGVDILA